MILLFIASFSFAMFEAHSTTEYATCLSTSIMVFTNVIFYTINMKEMKNIVKLIRKFEDYIEMSKLTLMNLEMIP